ncbi:MAG: glycosyl transferase family 36, partial [Ignavibacteriales bacterium]
MILNNEQIKQKAHELALTHDPYLSRWTSGALWKQYYKQVSDIRSFASLLQDSSASCAQPAEEWLLDNADFIEEQVIVVKQQLSRSFLRDLPNLRRTKQKRVLSICIDYLDHVDGNLDEDSLVMYLNSYQQVSVLSIAEVWSIPLMMRIALINHLAAVMDEVRKQRETCSLAERLLAGIDPTLLSPEVLKTALDKAGQEIPLSGSLIVQLIRLLREWADDSELVREWLICKLDNGPESLDRIVSYEYQLQASHQVTTGNLVGSLRNIARWDWNDRFEEISMVENTLVQESRGIYPRLDFSSRDLLRRQVEKLARRLCVPETLVAKQAVTLSTMEYEQILKEKKHCSDVEDVPGACEELPRKTLAAFYLLEPEGIKKLQQSMTLCGTPRFLPETRILPHATATYFVTLTVLLILALSGFSVWIRGNLHFSAAQWIIVVLALLVPASEWVVMTAHWLIECVRHPQALLKYDFSHGIPSEATTMVVV